MNNQSEGVSEKTPNDECPVRIRRQPTNITTNSVLIPRPLMSHIRVSEKRLFPRVVADAPTVQCSGGTAVLVQVLDEREVSGKTGLRWYLCCPPCSSSSMTPRPLFKKEKIVFYALNASDELILPQSTMFCDDPLGQTALKEMLVELYFFAM